MAGTLENLSQSMPITIQEKGEIYSFFKPKVDVDKLQSLDDVQRVFFVLRRQAAEILVDEKQSSEAGKEGQLKEAHEKEESTPSDLKKPDAANKEEETKAEGGDGFVEVKPEDTPGDEKNGTQSENATKTKEGEDIEKIEIGEKRLLRYIMMRWRSLGDVGKDKAWEYWCSVELVTTSAGDLKKVLCEEECDTTLTLGRRVNLAARPVGEGRYSIVQLHNGDREPSTHLAYKLVHPGPHKKHDPQDAQNIKHQASFMILVKNPKQPTPVTANTRNKRPALLPAHLLGGMGERGFVPMDPLDLLNYKGVVLLLVSLRDVLLDSKVDIKLDTSDSWSKAVHLEVVVALKDHAKLIKPLFEGTWE